MPRDLFGEVTRPSISIGNRKWYTVPVSLLSHSAIIVAVVAAPLLATPFLPKPSLRIGGVIIPVAPVPSPPPRPRPAELKPITNPDAAPVVVPDGIAPEKPSDFDTTFQDTGAPGIVGGTDNIDSVLAAPPPVAPPVPQPPVSAARFESLRRFVMCRRSIRRSRKRRECRVSSSSKLPLA